MRNPKASVRLAQTGRVYAVELRATPGTHGGVTLELHRDDCYFGPIAELALDEAQTFLRTFQAAVDEAYRRAKVAVRGAVVP